MAQIYAGINHRDDQRIAAEGQIPGRGRGDPPHVPQLADQWIAWIAGGVGDVVQSGVGHPGARRQPGNSGRFLAWRNGEPRDAVFRHEVEHGEAGANGQPRGCLLPGRIAAIYVKLPRLRLRSLLRRGRPGDDHLSRHEFGRGRGNNGPGASCGRPQGEDADEQQPERDSADQVSAWAHANLIANK